MTYRCEACRRNPCRCYELEIIRAERAGTWSRYELTCAEMREPPQSVKADQFPGRKRRA